MSSSRRSFHLCSRRKPRTTCAAIDSPCTSIGDKLIPEALLAAKEHVIADAIGKVGFWRCKTQFVPTPPSRPLRNLERQKNVKSRYIRQAAYHLQVEFDSDVPKTFEKLFAAGTLHTSGLAISTGKLHAYCVATFSLTRRYPNMCGQAASLKMPVV